MQLTVRADSDWLQTRVGYCAFLAAALALRDAVCSLQSAACSVQCASHTLQRGKRDQLLGCTSDSLAGGRPQLRG